MKYENNTFSHSLAASLASATDGRREVWPVQTNAIATIGSEKVGVYTDPQHSVDILLYPGCWLIRRTEKEGKIQLVNCGFKMEKGNLVFDPTWRDEKGRLSGVNWDDPKMGVSLFSLLFRRPKFTETGVKFWTGSEWATVTGLPLLK